MNAPPPHSTPPAPKGWLRRASGALRHSVRWRIVLVFWLLAGVLGLSFVGGAQRMLAAGWSQAAKPLVTDYLDRLVDDLGSPPSIEKAQALSKRLPISLGIDGPSVQWRSHPATAHDHSRAANDDAWRARDGERFWVRRSADGHRIVFGIAPEVLQRRPGAFWWTLAALILTTALAYRYVRRVLRPLDDIAAGARRFGHGDFARPIPTSPHGGELQELAQTLNTMGQDIQSMLEAKRALLLAISHELRSPITRARLNAELLPEDPATAPTRAALLRDLAEMTQLIHDLLEGERLNAGHSALQATWLNPQDLLQDLRITHPEVQIHSSDDLPRFWADPTRVRLLLRNLIHNAQGHGAPPIELTVSTNGQQLCWCLRDHGPGVPAAQLPQLGEAFFRPDEARSRSQGGVGLGLYLCHLIVQAHGGRLEIDNADPGLRVRACFPVQPTAASSPGV